MCLVLIAPHWPQASRWPFATGLVVNMRLQCAQSHRARVVASAVVTGRLPC